ncbi:MAG TPA: hypothetical protein VFG84_02875 [Gemmatimonadaceae bacterium]|nr:hypothetical protein [Gemmatimonadaceae bacterium]
MRFTSRCVRVIFAVATVGLFVLSACGERGGALTSGAGPVEVTDSAGVTTVRSLAADRAGTSAVDTVFVLGGKETPEESFYQVNGGNIGTNSAGDIFVLDLSAHHVQRFDSTGRHTGSFGAEGGGPGEFQFAFGLMTAADGRVWAVDIGKRAFVGWGGDGELLPQSPLPDGFAGGLMRRAEDGLVFAARDTSGQQLVLVPDSGQRIVLASLPRAERRDISLPSCGMGFSGMEPLFSPYLVWTTAENITVVARNPDYLIEVYDGDSLVRRLTRDVAPQPANSEVARASLGDGMVVGTPSGRRVCDPAEVVEKRGVAPYLPMVERLALAPDGTLWVERWAVDADSRSIDIFAPEGEYLGTLAPGTPMPVGFLPDGTILAVAEDDAGVQRLMAARLSVEWGAW